MKRMPNEYPCGMGDLKIMVSYDPNGWKQLIGGLVAVCAAFVVMLFI